MPASKKKAQLDSLERRSIALLWAYNGNDLVLLTFLPDERRFDEYCQANRKNFRVLSLGTWFMVTYQRYVKCETRISVSEVSVLAGKPPLETRVLNALVQLCVPFVCSNANPYTDQYTYNNSLGNIVLRKSQGGGPKHLMIWCSLQTVAWWGDPVVEQVLMTPIEKVSTKVDGIEQNGTSNGIYSSADSKYAGGEAAFELNVNNRSVNNFKKNRAEIYTTICETERQKDDDQFERWPRRNATPNSPKMETEETECKKDSLSAESITNCDDDDDDDSWGESPGDEFSVDPDFGVPNGPMNDAEFAASGEEDVGEREISVKLAEEFEWSQFDTIRSFDWEHLNIGIVVAHVEMEPSEQQQDTLLFFIYPLCTGERFPGILRLWTKKCLQTGQWISFRKSWSPFGSLNDGEYRPHPPMLRTLSFLGKVIIECEILFPRKKEEEIRTWWECQQKEVEGMGRNSPTPFIRYIEDESGIFAQRFLGTRQWAVLEHVPMEWSPTKSWWRIVHIRPAEFDKFVRN